MSIASRIRSHNLATAWTVAVLAGAALISLSGRPISPSGELQLARLLLPLAAMVSYLVYGLSQEGRNTSKLADSIYFMGFLWTLYALIDSLLIHRGDQIGANTVFVVFGYALVTTGMGMFLRLALMQFQTTLPDQVLESREEIELRVASFVGQLNQAQGELARWRTTAHVAIDAWVRDLSDTTARVQTEVERLHQESVERVTDAIESEVAGLITALMAAKQEIAALKTSVDSVNKQLGRGATALDKRFTALDQMFEERSRELERSVRQIATRLENVNIPEDLVVARFDAAWSRVEPSLSRAGKTFDGMNNAASDVQKNAAAVAATVDSLNSRMSSVQAGTVELLRLLDMLSKQNVGLQAQVASQSAMHLAAAEKAVEDARELGRELQGVVAEVLAFVRQHLTEAVR